MESDGYLSDEKRIKALNLVFVRRHLVLIGILELPDELTRRAPRCIWWSIDVDDTLGIALVSYNPLLIRHFCIY